MFTPSRYLRKIITPSEMHNARIRHLKSIKTFSCKKSSAVPFEPTVSVREIISAWEDPIIRVRTVLYNKMLKPRAFGTQDIDSFACVSHVKIFKCFRVQGKAVLLKYPV